MKILKSAKRVLPLGKGLIHITANVTVFVEKVIRHDPPLPGLNGPRFTCLEPRSTDHNTKAVEHWCKATVA